MGIEYSKRDVYGILVGDLKQTWRPEWFKRRPKGGFTNTLLPTINGGVDLCQFPEQLPAGLVYLYAKNPAVSLPSGHQTWPWKLPYDF